MRWPLPCCASGQTIYPAGVSDPSLANPPGPSPDSAIPPPPAAGLPPGTTPVWSPSGPASPNNSAPCKRSSSWNAPTAVQTQVYPPATAACQAGPAAQATWYTRIEYFHWNERIGGTDFVNENGTLFTLGYQRQIGIERFRAELFGGEVNYQGYDQVPVDPNSATSDYYLVPLTSKTDYLGVRGEYEMVLAGRLGRPLGTTRRPGHPFLDPRLP